jgi:hypothetical protein
VFRPFAELSATRIRVNLRHVPEALRPAQETPTRMTTRHENGVNGTRSAPEEGSDGGLIARLYGHW